MRRSGHWYTVTLVGLLLILGCASVDKKLNPEDPEIQLRALLEQWNHERELGGSCASGGRKYPYVDCGRIQAEIERLAIDYPSNSSILLANAVIAYETSQPQKAASYLDSLIGSNRADPSAVVLRSRLAIQDGNLPFARRLLEQQVQLAPDASEPREALASVYKLLGEFNLAERELQVAERLGAPTWRIDYNRGLLAEAQGDPAAAIEFYKKCLAENPGWRKAQSRLRGLESERGL
ncbi:tetratricopeptide repeat protein [Myxococcota bacterium]|nr:tetratricopeptide repeat protein [Myxococcota bacterium]